jgi:hypothetical protein
MECITIPEIVLNWTDWVPWKDIEKGKEDGGVKIDNEPGVYEVKFTDVEDSLTIGKTANLNKRIIRGLVLGRLPHSSGIKIREDINNRKIDPSKIIIRWAKTNRPAAAEEELHYRVKGELKYGTLPSYIRKALAK